MTPNEQPTLEELNAARIAAGVAVHILAGKTTPGVEVELLGKLAVADDALIAAQQARIGELTAERDTLLTLADGLDAALEDAGITDVFAQWRLSALRAKLAQGARPPADATEG